MFHNRKRYSILFRIISVILIQAFFLSNLALASPDFSLARWTANDDYLVRREALAKLYRDSRLIRLATSPRYLDLLTRHNALALLLPSGRYLMTPEIAANDLSLIRAAAHEDFEVLMQQEEKLHSTRYQRLKKRLLNNEEVMAPYRNLSGYKDITAEPDNIIFNDLIAKAFELLFIIDEYLVYPNTELSAEERQFIELMRPILEAKDSRGRYKNFSQVFFDVDRRTKVIQVLQEDKGKRFYRVANNKDDISKKLDTNTPEKALRETEQNKDDNGIPISQMKEKEIDRIGDRVDDLKVNRAYDRRKWVAIQLAAGKGERLQEIFKTIKPLIPVADKPMMKHFLSIARRLKLRTIVVTPKDDEEIEQAVTDLVNNTVPAPSEGTFNAFVAPYEKLKRFKGDILVIPADCVVQDSETLISVMNQHTTRERFKPLFGTVTSILSKPHGLDRIVRDKDAKVISIITQKEIDLLKKNGEAVKLQDGTVLTPERIENIKEVWVGIWIFRSKLYKTICSIWHRFHFILKFFITEKSIASFDKVERTQKVHTGKLKRRFLLFLYRRGLFGVYRSSKVDHLFDLNTKEQVEHANVILGKQKKIDTTSQKDSEELRKNNEKAFESYIKGIKKIAHFFLTEFFKRLSQEKQKAILDVFERHKSDKYDKDFIFRQAKVYLQDTNREDLWNAYNRSSYPREIKGLEDYADENGWSHLIENFQEWFATQPYMRFLEIAGIEKAGQAISTRPGLAPEGFREACEIFQDRGLPAPIEESIYVIESDFGKYIHEIFQELDNHEPETPYLKRLNVGTVADIFEAKMKDGREIILKVVPPSKREKVLKGITVIKGVMEELEKHKDEFKGEESIRISPTRFFAEFKKAVRRELNMSLEASQAKKLISKYPRGFSKPRIYYHMCTENVLVMDFIPGVKSTTIKDNKLRRRIAKKLIPVIALQALADGVFHSDPHPGNVFYDEKTNKISLFDFGQIGELDRKFRRDLIKFSLQLLDFEEKNKLKRVGYHLLGFLLRSRYAAKLSRFIYFNYLWYQEKHIDKKKRSKIVSKKVRSKRKTFDERKISYSYTSDFDKPLKEMFDKAIELKEDKDIAEMMDGFFSGLPGADTEIDRDKPEIEIVEFLEKHGRKIDQYNRQILINRIKDIIEQTKKEDIKKQPYILVDKAVYEAEATRLIIETPYADIINKIFAFVEQHIDISQQTSANEVGFKAEIASILRFHREGESIIPKIHRTLMAAERFGYPVISSVGMLIKSLFLAEGVQRILRREPLGRLIDKEADSSIKQTKAPKDPGNSANLLRYMFGYRNGIPGQTEPIGRNNGVMPGDMAEQRGGNDSLSNIYRELIPLERADIVGGGKGQPRYLADWVLGLDPEEIIRQNPELNQPSLYKDEAAMKAVTARVGEMLTGFELGTEEERKQIRARNREYLKSKGWWDEIKSIRYRPRFIEEEPNLPAVMDTIAQEIKRNESFRRNVVVPMIVHPDDIPKVTDEEVNRTIKNHIKSFAYLLQSVFFYSQGEQKEAEEAYQKALKQAEKEFPNLIQEKEQTMQKILESIRSIKEKHLRQTAEKAWLETIPMLKAQMEQGQAKRIGLLGFFNTGVISDDLFNLAEDIYMRPDYITKARYLFKLGLELYDVEKKSYHIPQDFALNLAFLDLHIKETRGPELLQSVLGITHGLFNRWAKMQASLLQTQLGEGLRAHYKQTKDKTMEASSYVKERGTAIVLGAGSFVVFPLVEMLRERLPDGTLKYEKIILVELGEGISEQALDDLIRRGTIAKNEAGQIEIVRSDASLILKGITSRIDEIMLAAAKKKSRKFPKKEIAELFKEIADPKQLVKYALPTEKRRFVGESINFAVFAMAIQDFASPIKDYIDIWSKYLTVSYKDREPLRQWERVYSNQVQKNIAGLVIEDLSRISTPQGIIFLTDSVGLQIEPYLDKKEERKDFYGPEGLRELVPRNLPLQIVNHSSWLRPLNLEEQERNEKANFIIESLVLRKGTLSSISPLVDTESIQQAFSALNQEARKTPQLNAGVSKLHGTSQKLMDVTKFRFCVPMEILRNAADITLALNSTELLKQKPQDTENIEFELVVTGVKDEDIAIIEGLNRDDIKKTLNLPSKFTVSMITETQIQETIDRFGYDISNPKHRVAAVKDFYSGAIADREYMAIATDAVKEEDAEDLKSEIEKDLQSELAEENISIRVVVRPKAGRSMYSLSKIINDWLEDINQGNPSSIAKILPIPTPITPELERAIKEAWAVLTAA